MVEGIDEFVVKNKRDLEKVSDKTRVLRINCELNTDDVRKIAKKCRLLEEVVFDRGIFMQLDDEVKQYLGKWFFVDYE